MERSATPAGGIRVSCPDCSGVVESHALAPGMVQFRCRVGHVYDAYELLTGKEEQLERRLWSTMTARASAARVVNGERTPRAIVGIGASAGGVEAMTRLFEALPADFPAAVAAVLHRSPHFCSHLTQVLGRRAAVPIREANEGDPIRPGLVYVAPRDRHLLVEDGVLRLDGGPREHFTRPAVDPLLRSMAASYGSASVGVILTGTGSDGVAGLLALKRAGGISLAQDPDEAPHRSMPVTSILRNHVDAVLPIAGIAAALVLLARGQPFVVPAVAVPRPAPA